MYIPTLPFEFWRLCLREDYVRNDKLRSFNALDDQCLKLIWETGALPCVLDIVQEEQTVN